MPVGTKQEGSWPALSNTPHSHFLNKQSLRWGLGRMVSKGVAHRSTGPHGKGRMPSFPQDLKVMEKPWRSSELSLPGREPSAVRMISGSSWRLRKQVANTFHRCVNTPLSALPGRPFPPWLCIHGAYSVLCTAPGLQASWNLLRSVNRGRGRWWEESVRYVHNLWAQTIGW